MPFLTTLAALTVAAATQDQTPPSGGPVEVQTRVMVLNGPGGEQGLDADKDGFVTRQEFAAPLDRAFAGMDKDGDGKLSKEERDAGHDPMAGGGPRVMRWTSGDVARGLETSIAGGDRDVQVFTLNGAAVQDGPDLDADKDGRVTEDEFLARIREAFRRMDKDGSGALEAGEHGSESGVRIITRRIETGDGHAH